MTTPFYSISFWAPPFAGTTLTVGNVALPDPGGSGSWLIASAANRGSARSEGIVISNTGGSPLGTFEIQNAGTIDAALVPNLGVGAASWVRASAAGLPERFTPVANGTSDIIGWCEASGRLHLQMGTLTENIVLSAGAGGGFTAGGLVGDVMIKAPASTSTGVTGNNGDTLLKTAGVWGNAPAVVTPTGTGVWRVLAGVMASAGSIGSSLQVLRTNVGASDLEWATPTAFIAPTGTGFATTTAGVLDGASLPFPLAVNKGGTHQAALGSALQVLRTNAGATDTEWATVSVSITGADTQITFFDGANNPAGNANFTVAKATGVMTVSSAIALGGGTPNTVAYVRVPYNGASVKTVVGAKTSGAADCVLVGFGSGNLATFGDAALDCTINGITGAINFTSTSSYLQFASSAHTTAMIRVPYNGAATKVIIGVKDASAVDQSLVTYGAGNAVTWCALAFTTTLLGNSLQFTSSTTTSLSNNSTNVFDTTSSLMNLTAALGGNATFTTPFKYQLAAFTMTGGAGAATTATAAAYSCPVIEVTTVADNQQLILPVPPAGTTAVFLIRVVAGGSATFFVRKTAGSGGVTMTSTAGFCQWVMYSPAKSDYTVAGQPVAA